MDVRDDACGAMWGCGEPLARACSLTPRAPSRALRVRVRVRLRYPSPAPRGTNASAGRITRLCADDVNQQEDTSEKSHNGYAALHCAAQKNYRDMLKLLLDNGATTTLLDKHGNTPKMLAEKKGHKEVIELLDAHKAPKEAPKKARSDASMLGKDNA